VKSMGRWGKVVLCGLAAVGAALVLVGTLAVQPTRHVGPPEPSPQAGEGVALQPRAQLRDVGNVSSRPGRRTPVRSLAASSVPQAPEEVSIRRLGVTAPVVEQVSVLTSGPERGLLGAPSDFHQLGWYMHGTSGVLVIDGHVGFAAGAGPLAYIGMLSRGDQVLVRFADRTRTYTVVAVEEALKGQLSPRYFSPAYDGQLMLITCDYQSPFSNGHFADDIFVIATPSP
jgi:hypothetical protein